MRRRSSSSFGSTGGRMYRPSGTLPRNTNRDLERLLSYRNADDAVYLAERSLTRGTVRHLATVSFPPAKHAVRRSKAMLLDVPTWRVALNRMPSRVRFCVQRGLRREVLFALARAGYSGSAPKREYKRTVNSNYGC